MLDMTPLGWLGHKTSTQTNIATDRHFFFHPKQCWYLSYSSLKTYIVGTHQKCLTEALLMNTQNICFHGAIRKILCVYPVLSVAMQCTSQQSGQSLCLTWHHRLSRMCQEEVLQFYTGTFSEVASQVEKSEETVPPGGCATKINPCHAE